MKALLINLAPIGGPPDHHPRHHVAPVDLAICAAILEGAGHEVQLWDTALDPRETLPELITRARASVPDLLLVRPLLGTASDAAALARACGGLRLVFGNAVDAARDTLIGDRPGGGAFDAALVGEPEPVLIDLLPHLAEGELPEQLLGLAKDTRRWAQPRPFLEQLDSLPAPAHHHLVGKGYQFHYPLDQPERLEMGYLLSSRGCALGCTFCSPSERESLGKGYRWRSAESIVEEIQQLKALGANALYFIDDFFSFSTARVRELCEAMIAAELQLPWAAQVRAHGLDSELLALMRAAGCSSLCFGAESGSDRMLKQVRKGVTTQLVREQVARIQAAGIATVGYFIVGMPGEGDEERAETYRFIEALGPDLAQVHIFNVMPGSSAEALYPELLAPEATKFSGPVALDARMDALDAERRRFYLRYYLGPRYLLRTLRRRGKALARNLPSEAAFALRSVRYFLGA